MNSLKIFVRILMKIPKIAYVIGSLQVGGSEMQLVHLLQNTSQDFIQHLFCFEGGPLEEELRKSNIEYTILDYTRNPSITGINMMRKYLSLRKALISYNPDIIQTHLSLTNILSSFIGKSMGIPVFLMEEGMGVTRPAWEKIIRKYAYRNVTKFACNSENIRNRMIQHEGVQKEKIDLILNSVQVEISTNKEQMRKELSIPMCTYVVISVGSLKPVKGTDYLIEGFALFAEYYSDCILLLAGSGLKRTQYENLAEDLGIASNVRFLGNRSDVGNLLNASDVFISASLSEGTSGAILEAMSAKIPVIATAVGGTVSIVEHETTGILIEASNDKDIMESLKMLHDNADLVDKIVFNASRFVQAEFSVEKNKQQFLKIYSSILQEIE